MPLRALRVLGLLALVHCGGAVTTTPTQDDAGDGCPLVPCPADSGAVVCCVGP